MPSGIYKRTKEMKTGHHTPWNKNKQGVYKHSEESLKKIKENHIGMLGKKHSTETKNKMIQTHKESPYGFQPGHIMTEEVKQIISDKFKGRMPSNTPKLGKYGNIIRGYFLIGNKNMFFRSKWEANYALYLEWLKKIGEIKDWQYEADTFWFEKIRRGIRSYKPDFKIFNNNGTIHYDEVKGYVDAASKTKINRMKIYHPNIKLNMIYEKDYYSIVKKVGKILNFY